MTRRKPKEPPIDMEALARSETVARLRLLADVRVQLVDLRREIKETEARCKGLGEDMAVMSELKRADPGRYAKVIGIARQINAAHRQADEDERQALAIIPTLEITPVKETAAKVAADRWGVSGSVVP